MPKSDETLPKPGEQVWWVRYDGGDEPTVFAGTVWSEAPAFTGMRARWIQIDAEMHYVARASRLYTTGASVDGRWHRGSGDVIEVGVFFEEVHPQSNMVKSLERQQKKLARKVTTHQGQTELLAFTALCDRLSK